MRFGNIQGAFFIVLTVLYYSLYYTVLITKYEFLVFGVVIHLLGIRGQEIKYANQKRKRQAD